MSFINLSLNKLKFITGLITSFSLNINLQDDALITIDVNSNQIQSIDELINLKFLYSIDLWQNQIKKCSYVPSNNFPELQIISLDQNKINYIEDFSFKDFTNLKEVYPEMS